MRISTRLAIGGLAVHVLTLTNLMSPDEFTSVVVTGAASDSEGDITQLRGEKNSAAVTVLIPSLVRRVNPILDLKSIIKIINVIREWQPDIVETHGAKAGALGRLSRLFIHVPIIIHVFHGNVFKHHFGSLKTRFFILVERFLARYTDCFIVLCESQKRELIFYKIGNKEKIRIVPLGIEIDDFQGLGSDVATLRTELALSSKCPIVGIVGRLVPIKAVDLFLSAAVEVLKEVNDAIFIVVGDGDLRNELERNAHNLCLSDSVKFLGFRNDLSNIYSSLNCLVMCSLNEGQPTVLIEAMACGCPIVATDVGCIREMIYRIDGAAAGIVIPPNDIKRLASTIVRLLKDRESAEVLSNNARVVATCYGREKLIKNMGMLYRDLLRNCPHKASNNQL